MIILNCDQHRNLSFVDKKYRILQGEHKFDELKINMPESIDGVDDMQGVSIKMHFVSGNEHIDRQVVLENGYISIDIDYTLTEKSKRWLLYLAFYVNVDGEVEIGKTNAIAIQVNKLPYSDTLAKEYKEPEIVLIKGDKGDKGDPGEDGKSAYEIAVEHGYEGTEEEWLSEMKDYNELDNKPQINRVTLSGNKTSDDLNLQGKLTAGENITISDDNVISAEGGGVTSYNDLTDKPAFQTQWESSLFDLSGVNVFNDFGSYKDSDGKRIWSIMVDELIPRIPNFSITFNQLVDVIRIFRTETPYQGALNPNEIIDWNDGMPNKAIPFQGIYPNLGINNKGYGLLINLVDSNIYAQLFVWLDYQDIPHIGYRAKTAHTNWSDLIELGSGGSQIVSGVVNANGTITFTDSDGNTFTTTGTSVIGPQGDDYVLTAQDKSDIADIVLSELPTTQGVQYGN